MGLDRSTAGTAATSIPPGSAPWGPVTIGLSIWEWCQERCANGVDVSEVLEGTWYPYSREQIAGWPRD